VAAQSGDKRLDDAGETQGLSSITPQNFASLADLQIARAAQAQLNDNAFAASTGWILGDKIEPKGLPPSANCL
jgi:hypothetical protein